MGIQQKLILIKVIFLTVVCTSVILITFLMFDSNVENSLYSAESQEIVNTDYKSGFEDMLEKIDSGIPTGIPTVDDAGVSYGDKITITKGVGDFVNFKPEWKATTKSFTYIQHKYPSYNLINWSSSSGQYVMAFSKLLYQNSTLYDGSGVLKLFDRYNWCALGTYWTEKIGITEDINRPGETFRVYMDNGKTYDLILFDAKSAGDARYDSTSIRAPQPKQAIAHYKGNGTVCVTEFDILDLKVNFPIKPAGTSKHPEMRYNELVSMKSDPDHLKYKTSLGSIPEFSGEVVALQPINDPRVDELMEKAKEEVRGYGWSG